jgi:hypothetical protein
MESIFRRHIYLTEVLLWITGVGVLAAMDPVGDHLFSFCPFSWVLKDFCPGCGLGHSIAFLFRGEILASWKTHPLGIPAVAVLLLRCINLLRWHFKLNHT